MGDEVAAVARDDPDRQAGAAAELREHDRHQHGMAVAALEHAVDQQLTVGAGGQRRAGDDLGQRAQLRLRVVLDLDEDGGAQRAQRTFDAVGVELAELPRQ